MSKDSNAQWILQNEREELIRSWFSDKSSQVREIRFQVEKTAYGETKSDWSPSAIHEEIGRLRKQAVYLKLLATEMLAERQKLWAATHAEVTADIVQGQIDNMQGDVDLIGEIHQRIGGLVAKSGSNGSRELFE